MFKSVKFRTPERQIMVNVMDEVLQIVAESGVQEGMCYVYCPHTTAGLVVNSYLDPMTRKDISFELDRIAPTRVDFFHQVDTPSDAAGHVKSSLVGIHLSFMIHEGKLMLGHSQGILFAEFDGPRDRQVHVKIVEG
ncbi:MAG: YjbQ family protein [Anaerolineae bacterium]|nr:YjbQ family protein [Anaerolineae bacterium]